MYSVLLLLLLILVLLSIVTAVVMITNAAANDTPIDYMTTVYQEWLAKKSTKSSNDF